MLREKPQLIDDGTRFGQDMHPFRLHRSGIGLLLEGLLKLLVLPMLISAPLIFVAMLIALWLLPEKTADAFFVVCSVATYSTAVSLLLKAHSIRYYDRQTHRFHVRAWHLFRPNELSWEQDLFNGISTGIRSVHAKGGGYPVVRLHTKVEGFLLDDFLSADSREQARALAQRLSELSGLPLLAERDTGSQHDLNDLRNNAWLVRRQAKR